MEIEIVASLCVISGVCGYFVYPLLEQYKKEKGKMRWDN